VEFLNVLKNYDPLLENHLNPATGFQGISQIIKCDLIKSISTVVKEEMKKKFKQLDSF
jgi:hypothetical protein